MESPVNTMFKIFNVYISLKHIPPIAKGLNNILRTQTILSLDKNPYSKHIFRNLQNLCYVVIKILREGVQMEILRHEFRLLKNI